MSTFKSEGAKAQIASGTSIAVPVGARVVNDYTVIVVAVVVGTTPAVASYSGDPYQAVVFPDGAGGSIQFLWRRSTGTEAAANQTVTLPSSTAAWGISSTWTQTAAVNAAPTVVQGDFLTAAYCQSGAITTTIPRNAWHLGLVYTAVTGGSITNQGTITSTNTARNHQTISPAVNGMVRLSTFTSAITSAGGGAVRRALGASADSITFTLLIPEPAPAAPTINSITAGTRALTPSVTVSGSATRLQRRWKRPSLVRPSATVQSGAGAWLRRICQENLPLPSSYTYDFTGAGRMVFLVDTGARVTHNEFGGRYITGSSIYNPWNVDTAEDPPFTQGHGTGVGAVALGVTYGVAKGATLVSINAGPEAGPTMDQYEAALAFMLATKPADETVVANFSNGLPEDDPTRALAFLNDMAENGILAMFAAGNGNSNFDRYAPLDDVRLVIGASTAADVKASYSDYGTGIDLYAPISPLTTAGKSSDTATRSGDGTSEAVPMGVGVAARILQGNPHLSVKRLCRLLRSQAFLNKITGAGPAENRVLNGNANTDVWTVEEVAVGTPNEVLDGLEGNVLYDMGYRQEVGGVWSDWSSTSSQTTLPDIPPEGDFGGTYGWGPATLDGERDSEGSFGGSYGWGSATFTGSRDSEAGFGGTYGWGPSEASGERDSEGGFSTSYGWGPAQFAGITDHEGNFAGSYGWGPATFDGSVPSGGGFGGTYGWGPASLEGERDSEGSFGGTYGWGPSTFTGQGGAAGGFGGTYGWGPAQADGASPSEGDFSGTYGWGPATADGVRDSEGAFTAPGYGWGPATFEGPEGASGDFGGTYGWGPATLDGETPHRGVFGGSYGWGPARFQGPPTQGPLPTNGGLALYVPTRGLVASAPRRGLVVL